MLKGHKKDLDKICQEIENEAFGINKFKTKELDSILRGIQISDSTEIDNSKLAIMQKEDYSSNSSKPSRLPLWREYLNSYVTINFTITIDETIFPYTIEDIEKALNETAKFYDKLVANKYDLEKIDAYLPLDEEKYNTNICLGGGSGFMAKTIIYQLAPNENEAKNAIAQFLDVIFPIHKHVEKDTKIAPRALKLVKENYDYVCVGWGELRKA